MLDRNHLVHCKIRKLLGAGDLSACGYDKDKVTGSYKYVCCRAKSLVAEIMLCSVLCSHVLFTQLDAIVINQGMPTVA